MLALAVVSVLTLLPATPAPNAPAPPSLAGEWVLNKDLSDDRSAAPDGERSPVGETGRHGGGGGHGRGGGRGGFGGGGFGGGGRGGPAMDPEQAQRMREALREELQAPERLTITESGTTIVMTSGDGRTTRLSIDGKKIKDETTKIERRTRWDGDKLTSEVNGLGRGKITETYRVDPEQKQLHVTIAIENQQRPVTINRLYDLQAR
jgi:hypothetical protein